MTRRSLLLGLLGGAIGLGCGASSARVLPAVPPARPVAVRSLDDLVHASSLRWQLSLRPAALLAEPALQPAIGRLLRDERLELFARTTGLELRALPELVVAAFVDDSLLLLARHDADPLGLERRFRARLTGDERRAVAPGGIVRVTGRIGREPRAFVALGPTVVGLQFGGSLRDGPALVAQLYAEGALAGAPSLSRDPLFGPTFAALGEAPIRWLLPGPFDAELASGAHGLLAVATAVAASLAPAGSRELVLTALIDGGFESAPERAAELLRETWHDLARSELGSLTGLATAHAEPTTAAEPGRLRLTVKLEAEALASGLAAATMDEVREIMR